MTIKIELDTLTQADHNRFHLAFKHDRFGFEDPLKTFSKRPFKISRTTDGNFQVSYRDHNIFSVFSNGSRTMTRRTLMIEDNVPENVIGIIRSAVENVVNVAREIDRIRQSDKRDIKRKMSQYVTDGAGDPLSKEEAFLIRHHAHSPDFQVHTRYQELHYEIFHLSFGGSVFPEDARSIDIHRHVGGDEYVSSPGVRKDTVLSGARERFDAALRDAEISPRTEPVALSEEQKILFSAAEKQDIAEDGVLYEFKTQMVSISSQSGMIAEIFHEKNADDLIIRSGVVLEEAQKNGIVAALARILSRPDFAAKDPKIEKEQAVREFSEILSREDVGYGF